MTGFVIIDTRTEVVHQGLTLTMDGAVNMQLSSKSVGLFEAFYQSAKVRILADLAEHTDQQR